MSSDLILASASPRRAELLRQIGVRFSVQTADVPEIYRLGERPEDYVRRLSEAKARALAAGQSRTRSHARHLKGEFCGMQSLLPRTL